MTHTETRTYKPLKPRHLIKRTALAHAAILNRRYNANLYRKPTYPRYTVRDAGRGPFRWFVADWGEVL